jgi:threonine/homoserine/homoserine lactone efflux protein
MPGIHDLALFVIAGVLLNLTPGPDTLYILSQGASRGFRGGAVAALGIGTGCLLHITAAALGLSALLFASATAFAVVRWLGALYLIWIGISMLRSGLPNAARAGAATGGDLKGVFLRGVLTNALNPKVAMFFLAFLPQFVDPASTHRTLAFLTLGVLFNVTGTLWNLALAWLGSSAAGRMRGGARLGQWLTRGVGALFVVVGIRLLVADRVNP